jgi:phosphoribosylformimino-5-aminoimidazole carboxamide ribotide isomerase
MWRVIRRLLMLIIPAIDLKGGQCVRLLRGEMAASTVYGDDPVAVGRRWVDAGARYVHVVDLDGAISGAPVNAAPIAALCAALPVPVQVGGGVRTLDRAGTILGYGADRVIFGTAALENPDVVADAAARFPGRVAVGIDARGGQVAVKGWVETSATTASELARRLEGSGVACLIYTDIERDGTQQGVNVAATRALAEATSIPVIASGGVGSLADIEALLPCEAAGVVGVIVGRALYTGAVRLEDALRLTA